MPVETYPEWRQLALWAGGVALLLTLLFKVPVVGRALRALFSLALFAFTLFVLFQQAPFEPNLARLTQRLGLDRQEVVGEAVHIRLSRDGHFWANASINGVPRRMLIDTGATTTALSEQTAQLAAVDRGKNLLPVMMRTANGVVRADTGAIDTLVLGDIEARGLNVIISPALGTMDILGMNFLSQLKSWRVEGRTLILVPNPPAAPGAPRSAPKRAPKGAPGASGA